jgi:hypothetical protein
MLNLEYSLAFEDIPLLGFLLVEKLIIVGIKMNS